MDDALRFASVAGVKQLLIAHHDPAYTDIKLDEIFSDLKKRNNYPFKYKLAVEGMEIELS